MAAERDAAGQAGSGLTGGGYGNRDVAGMNAGTTGSQSMGDRPGTGEVRTGLHAGGGAGEYGGIAFAGQQEEQGLRGKAASAARDAADTVRERAGSVGERASSVASAARERVGSVAGRAQTLMEDRGLFDNPLPALGGAFAIGFLLASLGETRQTKATRARNELRNALMAGLSAGVAQGARGFLGQAGRSEGFLNSVLRNVLGGQESSGSASGSGSYGGSTGRSSGGTTSGGAYGGASASRPGTATGGRTGATSGAYTGGSTGQHRPPSHRENL